MSEILKYIGRYGVPLVPAGIATWKVEDRGSICGEPCGVTNYLGTVAALSGHRDTLHDSAFRGETI